MKNTKKSCQKNYPTHGEGMERFENAIVKASQTGGKYNGTRTGATRLTQTVRTAVSEHYYHARRRSKNKTRSPDREARTGACEISPTLSALEESQNIQKDRHRYGLCHTAREKAEYKRSLTTKSITSVSMGIRIRRRGNALTAS